jgi:hypothetical protein
VTTDSGCGGPVPGVVAALQPVAHGLLQALEDVERACAGVAGEDLWRRPGGAASAGFHLRHMAGSLDRLFTYARGEALTDVQRAALAAEKEVSPEVTAAELVTRSARWSRLHWRSCARPRLACWTSRGRWVGRGCRRRCGGCCITARSIRRGTRVSSSRR